MNGGKVKYMIIGALATVLLIVQAFAIVIAAIFSMFFGQGTTYSLPEIVGRQTEINGEFKYSGDDTFSDREFKWMIKKCRQDAGEMQKSTVFQFRASEAESVKLQKRRKKVMATSVLYYALINDGYNADNITEKNVANWKSNDSSYSSYYAEFLKKPSYTSDEWTNYAECFSGNDFMAEGYERNADDTWTNLKNRYGISYSDDEFSMLLDIAKVMNEVVVCVPIAEVGLEEFKGKSVAYPYSTEECQALWNQIYKDHEENKAVMFGGLWNRSIPQCTDFASWRLWKTYGFGTAGGNGEYVAQLLVNARPDKFKLIDASLSNTPTAGSIGSWYSLKTNALGEQYVDRHVFYVEDYDAEKKVITISDGNILMAGESGGIRINYKTSYTSMLKQHDWIQFAVPVVDNLTSNPLN